MMDENDLLERLDGFPSGEPKTENRRLPPMRQRVGEIATHWIGKAMTVLRLATILGNMKRKGKRS